MGSNTVNRGMLKNRARDGRLMARCNYRLTDDYQYDAATNFGETDWMPVVLDDREDGKLTLRTDCFRGRGSAWRNNDETITLIVHSNLSYSLKIVD